MKFTLKSALVLVLALVHRSQSSHVQPSPCPHCQGTGRVQPAEPMEPEKYNPKLDTPPDPHAYCCAKSAPQCARGIKSAAAWYVSPKRDKSLDDSIPSSGPSAMESCCCSRHFKQDTEGLCQPLGPFALHFRNGDGVYEKPLNLGWI